MTASIVVFGSLNMDQSIELRRLPAPGETVMADRMRFTAGGKGANQAVSAARMGGKVAFVGCVGDDDHGSAMVLRLQEENIDTTHVRTIPEMSTGLAVVAVEATGQNSIMVVPGANYETAAEEMEALDAVLNEKSTLIVQLEVPTERVAQALKIARHRGARTVLNAAPATDVTALLGDVEVLIVNETEAEILAGVSVQDLETAAQAAEKLSGQYDLDVIVTCGESGAVTCTQAVTTNIPPFPVAAVDTVGAGDAFVGALAVALDEDRELNDAARLASAAGAAATTRVGAQDALPRRGDLAELFGVR